VTRELARAGTFRRLATGVALLALAVPAGISAGASAAASQASVTDVLLSARAPASQLEATRTINFSGFSIHRFRQTVGGIPVLNGEVAVIDGEGSAASVVTDTTAANVTAPPAASVSASRAVAIAKAATGAHGARVAPAASLGIDPAHANALVRRVVIASKRPLNDFEVLVDAANGKVLSKRSLLQFAGQTGRAKLYTPNPVVENGGYGGIGSGVSADNHDHDTAKLTSLRNPVHLPRIKSGQHCLNGTYVDSRVGSKAKPVCRRSLNWKGVTRSNDKFEALEAYQQIDQIQNYFHAIGFTGSSNVHPKRQKVIVDAFAQDNSFYSPSDKKIRYGRGGVDDAEDGDVVVHEYGHSIQDAQDPGFGSGDQAGGLGEGFGDFMSVINTAISQPPVPIGYLNHAEFCIFDWDGTSGYGGPGVKPCGRVANGSDGITTFPVAESACRIPHSGGRLEIHCLGEVWVHGLIDLLNSIPLESGKPPIVLDLLTSQFTYADNESFAQAVNGLVAADTAIYGGTHITAICTEMKTNRGITASSRP
jgi:Zn-dependent metalloprotease